MIRVMKDGDLFESEAQTLVNTVNTVGVMGKGIALGFKQRFPDMYKDYVRRCHLGEVKLGEPYVYKRAIPPCIVNFPTKEHWRGAARLDAIVDGLQVLKRYCEDWGIESLAVPPLGCGEGGLDWKVVGPTLYRALSTLNVPVELFAPWGTPAEELSDAFLSDPARAAAGGNQSRNPVPPAWVALAEILRRIHKEPYHYPIGHIGFQKLAYFATALGLPTGLTFERGAFGPFASGGKMLMNQMVNNGLLTETPVGQMIRVDPGRTLTDARERYSAELLGWDAEMARVVDLLLRMNGREAELAATVHFVALALERELKRIPTEIEVLQAVASWKARRDPPFRVADVAQPIRRMNLAGWIHADYSPKLPVPKEAAA